MALGGLVQQTAVILDVPGKDNVGTAEQLRQLAVNLRPGTNSMLRRRRYPPLGQAHHIGIPLCSGGTVCGASWSGWRFLEQQLQLLSTGKPSAGSVAALAPGVPLGVGQVMLLQRRQRQVLGAVPVASDDGGVESPTRVAGGLRPPPTASGWAPITRIPPAR